MTDSPIAMHLKFLKGTPVFATSSSEPSLKRVYGFTLHKATGLALFPAFFPFSQYVKSDLEIVFGNAVGWTPEAQEWLEVMDERAERFAAGVLPDGMTWVTSPFDHQRSAVMQGIWNERYAFFHDCGLGKTKTMIDTFRGIRCISPESKMLVLCPGHLPRIWQRQIEEHAGGELECFAMVDHNNKSPSPDKRKELYTGKRTVEVDPSTWFHAECPDVLYTPLPRDTSEDILERELQYLRACQAGDGIAMSKLRNQLRYRAKKYGVNLPDPARKLGPVPRPVNDYDVMAMSYDLLKPDWHLVQKYFEYDVIVADESHYMRSARSTRTKMAWKLSGLARRRYLMSGTPALGDPMHLYGQLRFLAPFLSEDWWKYSRRYVVWKKLATHSMPVAYKNLHVLNEIVEEVADRKKTEDCLDLPDMKFITVPVDLDEASRAMYNDMVKSYTMELNNREIRPANAADRLNKLLQVLSGFVIDNGMAYDICNECPHLMHCVASEIEPYTPACRIQQDEPPKTTIELENTPRLDALKGLLEEILASEENKVIVWCRFLRELDMAEDLLRAEGVGFVRVDGSTKDSVAAQDEFNNNPDTKVYLAQVATGIGVTLNAANYTIYYGVTYNLDHYIQSQKRNHRAGQTRPVTVYLLATPGSVHEYVFKALDRKQDISNTLTDCIRCGICERAEECAQKDVKPFDEECVYDATARRIVTRPALL
jgi:SNF2 family DNA or RNA helicase